MRPEPFRVKLSTVHIDGIALELRSVNGPRIRILRRTRYWLMRRVLPIAVSEEGLTFS